MLKQDRKIPSGSRIAKLLLSGGLVLSSVAYAVWQQRQPAMEVTAQPHSRTAAAPHPSVAPAQIVRVENSPSQPLASARPAPSAPVKTIPAQGPVPPAASLQTVAPAEAQTANVPPPADTAATAAPPPPAPEPTTVYASDVPHYADGEYVGASMDTEWGPVQVKVVVSDGAIADVVCIDYPNHRRRSADISSWAIPILTTEAIKSQKWEVDAVSQASYTSYGFQQSLQSALARAHK